MASVGKPGFFHNRSLQETRCYTHTSLQIVWQSYQQILDFWQKWKGRKFCALGLLQHFISTQRWAYPLGISPTTSMLYLLGSSQKCVMIVAAMTCWLKKNNVTPVSLVLFIFLSCKQPLSCATIAFPGSSVIIGVKTLPAGCINQYTCCFTGRERMKEKLKGRLTTTSSIGIGNGSFCR